MTSDDTKSCGGKYYEFESVAKKAMKEYDVAYRKIEFLTEETNVYFRVESENGESYALKIFQEESSSIDDNMAEVFFVSNISGVETPEIVENRHGSGITVVESESFDKPKRTALYTWMDGEDFYENETEELFVKLGEITAQLHIKTRDIIIPAFIKPKRWDKVFYYDGELPVYGERKYSVFIDDETKKIMDGIVPYLNSRLEGLYGNKKPQLIHADLNPWNVRIFEGKIRILDFEDAMLGFPVHDLAIILYYYRYSKDWDFEKVKGLVLSGYKNVIPDAEFNGEDIEMLMIARRVNFLNYSLVIDENPCDYIRICSERISAFMDERNLR